MPCASAISLTPWPMPQPARPDWWQRLRKTSASNRRRAAGGPRKNAAAAPAAGPHQGDKGRQGQGNRGRQRGKETIGSKARSGGDATAPIATQTVPAAPTVPEAVPATPKRARTSGALALVAALALATVADIFRSRAWPKYFPALRWRSWFAATMEAGKLVIAGWLAAHWRRIKWTMCTVMVALVAGLALINAAGVFGKLVEAHVGAAASSRSGVTERIEALNARVTAQTAAVADLNNRIAQIDRAVDEFTRRGRVTRALNIATQQRLTRDGLDTQRQAATATLVGLQAQRAALVGERTRIEASAGPIQYLAMMVGAAPEAAVRWLILLMVLCCDPAAIALTVAALASLR